MPLPKARSLLSLCLLSTACITASGQLTASQTAAVDHLLSTYISAHHVPGLSVAVVTNGRVAYLHGYGVADVENSVPATPDTVYRLASVSKPLTAVGTMRLVEKGRLNLDAPIQEYCPAFPKKPWTITTRELLSHQSGIRDYRDEAETRNTRHYNSIQEALSQFSKDPLDFEPGTRMHYTSYGYVALGCVLEGASGSDYKSFMRDAVFVPAGMTETMLDDVFAIVPHRAHGYQLTDGGQLLNAAFVDVSNKPPGSGINSSVRDMGAFLSALYDGRLVSAQTFAEMLVPSKTQDGKPTIYGLGFYRGGPICEYRGLLEAGHGGDQQGVSTAMELLPSERFGVVLLCNLEGHNISLDFVSLSRQIYDIVHDGHPPGGSFGNQSEDRSR